MSRFFVGQRVRIAYSRTGLHQNKTGVVIGVNYTGRVRGVGCINAGLRVDIGEALPVLDDPWRFAPIYDGHQPVSWESCLWQPSPQEENA